MKFILEEINCFPWQTSCSLGVVRHRNKNLDPASVPGKAKEKEFKSTETF